MRSAPKTRRQQSEPHKVVRVGKGPARYKRAGPVRCLPRMVIGMYAHLGRIMAAMCKHGLADQISRRFVVKPELDKSFPKKLESGSI